MDKKRLTVKKTVVRKSKRRKVALFLKKSVRFIVALLSPLFSYFSRFCYEKKKPLTLLVLSGIFFLCLVVSYKYVHAKMEETDLFSDAYILERVGRLTKLPEEKPVSLVRVEDGEKLRKEHSFYADVKEGDYIIAYPKLFIIYDAVHDEIEGLKASTKE